MPYCDNFWHIDAYENIPSPASLIVLVKNQKLRTSFIRLFTAYLSAEHNM